MADASGGAAAPAPDYGGSSSSDEEATKPSKRDPHKKKKSKKHSRHKHKRSKSRGSSSSSGSSSEDSRSDESESESDSESDSGSSSDSESEDERDRRKRKKRKKEKKEKKSKSKKHKKEKEKKKHKKEHKHKSSKKKSKKSKHGKSSSEQVAAKVKEFGAYGILHAEDRYSKQTEFYLWLREVKLVEPQNCPAHVLTEHFESYAEDYNTVTFPHDKYYSYEAWEVKERARLEKEAKKGYGAALEAHEAKAGSFSILQDEAEKRRGHLAKNTMKMSRAQAEEMRQVMRERSEQGARKDLGLKVDEKKGLRVQTMLRGELGFGQSAMHGGK